MKKYVKIVSYLFICVFTCFLFNTKFEAKEMTCTYNGDGFILSFDMQFTSNGAIIINHKIDSFTKVNIYTPTIYLLENTGNKNQSLTAAPSSWAKDVIDVYRKSEQNIYMINFDDSKIQNYLKKNKTCPLYMSLFYKAIVEENKGVGVDRVKVYLSLENDDLTLINQINSLCNSDNDCYSGEAYYACTKFSNKVVAKTIEKGDDSDSNDSEDDLLKYKECSKNKNKNTCIENPNPRCIWKEDYAINGQQGYCSMNGLVYVSCGKNAKKCYTDSTKNNTTAYDIPVIIPELTSFAVTLLKILTPVILIIMGMVQMIKALASQKEDEIKKGQNSLVKKLIISAMIFFIVTIVQFVISKISAGSEKDSATACLQCFLNGTDDCGLLYYRNSNGKCVSVSKTNKSPNEKYSESDS